MSDQFTEVTKRGWGSRIMDSIKGILIGFILFLVSFGVLYMNEGTVDVSEIANTAVEISSTEIATNEIDGKLVSSTGKLESNEKIADDYLKEGSYITLKRNAEIYAWRENTSSKSETNLGGSETTTTTYTYSKEWTSNPDDSSGFKKPENHSNPQMTIASNSKHINSAKLGIYELDINQIALPGGGKIDLTKENTILNPDLELANNEYLFQGYGTIDNPEVGDIRISYSALKSPIETATVFGKLDLNNKKILSYYGKKNSKLYRVFKGTRDGSVSTLKSEHKMRMWIFRLIGFMMMWIGLKALFGPISVFLDVLPIFGSISRTGIGIVTFIVALILSVITILISMLVHSIIALIITMIALVGLAIFYMKTKRKKLSK